MGLRKFLQGGETFYMYSQLHTSKDKEEEIKIIILHGSPFKVQLSPNNDSVLKWCRILEKNPQEYLTHLIKAVNCIASYNTSDEANDNKEDVFEIQEDCLVWKQYFPDKEVFGKRGKFKLEKVRYEDAVREVLDGTVQDLESNTKHIQNLTKESQEKSKKLNEAMELACRSVNAKEEFEKEIYGKCAAIINTKKLKIRQLKYNHPVTSGKDIGLSATEDTSTTSHPSKKAKFEGSDSDCYNSDTDVDSPEQDMDTDEECRVTLSPCKQKRNTNVGSYNADRTNKSKKALDSQDLFNNSLDLELYPSGTSGIKQKELSEKYEGSKDILLYPNRSKTSKSERLDIVSLEKESQDNRTLSKSTIDPVDSQTSIIDELF